MKKVIVIILIVLILFFVIISGGYLYIKDYKGDNENIINLQERLNILNQESKQGFLRLVENSIRDKDKDAFLDLVYWEGVTEDNRKTQGEVFSDILKYEKYDLENIQFSSEEFENDQDNIIGGISYEPNLEVEGLIEVKFTEQPWFDFSGSMTLPYGKKDNKYFLISVTEKEVVGLDADEQQDKQFQVMLMNYSSTSKPEYKIQGYCTYTQGGKQKKKEWDTGGTELFWAQEIQRCEFTDLTGEYGIDLTISVADSDDPIFRTIFEKEVQGDEKVVYDPKESD